MIERHISHEVSSPEVGQWLQLAGRAGQWLVKGFDVCHEYLTCQRGTLNEGDEKFCLLSLNP